MTWEPRQKRWSSGVIIEESGQSYRGRHDDVFVLQGRRRVSIADDEIFRRGTNNNNAGPRSVSTHTIYNVVGTISPTRCVTTGTPYF